MGDCSYSPYNRPLTLEPQGRSADSDWQIQEAIKNQLFWSPFVDSDDITVTAKDRVATLRGKVDNQMECGAAIDNAYQGGAISLKNELKVNGEPTS